MEFDLDEQAQEDYRLLMVTTCNPFSAGNVYEAIADEVLVPHISEIAEALSLGHNAAVGGIIANALTKYWQQEARKQAGFV